MAQASETESLQDLKDVLKQTLEGSGALGQVRAKIRAEIFKALEEGDAAPPALSNENMLINELIRDYLEFNNYHQTLSVFLPETGQPAVRPFDRATLASELQVTSVSGAGEAEGDDATTAPLLYSFLRPQSGVDDR